MLNPANVKNNSANIAKVHRRILPNIRWQLVIYDLIIFLISTALMTAICYLENPSTHFYLLSISAIVFLCIFVVRVICSVYQQVWRYGGIQCYIRLLFADVIAIAVCFFVDAVFYIDRVSFISLLSVTTVYTLGSLFIRMMYRYAFKCGYTDTLRGRFCAKLLYIFAGKEFKYRSLISGEKINLAIIGAGRIGVSLAEELLTNPASPYTPVCFVDISKSKAQRSIKGIPVLLEDEKIFENLKSIGIQEIVFAIANFSDKKEVYDRYRQAGYKTKVYDYPVIQTGGGKRHIRNFDIEELLFRKQVVINNAKTCAYYRNKVVLITGGGGSIGSELCRQLAKMDPKKIIVLDIYENGAYDLQQELRIAYGDKLDVSLEIVSVTNEREMDKVFGTYRPDIVIHAAAHKHVPLMEKNCIEAVANNIFGTAALIELCEKHNAERFMMVSTDKAVNPTNIMGATKRMCEMLTLCASRYGKVKYSATRFGNVLGSAGSVVPLFAKQIASGGPITLTDKRIIRYFMTIPEAAMLVLESGAMAKNGELFVLDMGKPVKIEDLARSMIELSGARGIEIVETGLRPGEKLYEELLVKPEELEKTENKLIFVEHDAPLSKEVIDDKMHILRSACETGSDAVVRDALHDVVPTYREA